MSDMYELTKRGVGIRELDGNPEKAIVYLERAYKLSRYSHERASIQGELALCYHLMGNYAKAEDLYESALEDLVLHSDVIGAARIRRQLSALVLEAGGSIEDALSLALRARSAVVNSGIHSNDLCHMTHGVIKVFLKKRKVEGLLHWFTNTKTILELTNTERKEIKEMAEKEKSIKKYVWITGFWADVARVFPPFTYPAALFGLYVAKSNGLGMRLRQAKSIL